MSTLVKMFVLGALSGDGEGVERGRVYFDARVGVPVVEFVVVLVEDGGDRGAVAVLGFAHEDGADFAEEAMGAVKEVDLGAFDVDLDETGWRRVCSRSQSRVMQRAWVGLAGASGLRVFGDGGEMV